MSGATPPRGGGARCAATARTAVPISTELISYLRPSTHRKEIGERKLEPSCHHPGCRGLRTAARDVVCRTSRLPGDRMFPLFVATA